MDWIKEMAFLKSFHSPHLMVLTLLQYVAGWTGSIVCQWLWNLAWTDL